MVDEEDKIQIQELEIKTITCRTIIIIIIFFLTKGPLPLSSVNHAPL